MNEKLIYEVKMIDFILDVLYLSYLGNIFLKREKRCLVGSYKFDLG